MPVCGLFCRACTLRYRLFRLYGRLHVGSVSLFPACRRISYLCPYVGIPRGAVVFVHLGHVGG